MRKSSLLQALFFKLSLLFVLDSEVVCSRGCTIRVLVITVCMEVFGFVTTSLGSDLLPTSLGVCLSQHNTRKTGGTFSFYIMQLTLMRVGGHEEHGRHEGHIRKNIIACGENRAKLRTAYGENRAKKCELPMAKIPMFL